MQYSLLISDVVMAVGYQDRVQVVSEWVAGYSDGCRGGLGWVGGGDRTVVGGVRTVQMLQTSTVQYFVSKIYWGLSVGTGSVYLEIRHVHIVPVTDLSSSRVRIDFHGTFSYYVAVVL
jgi:hypothetical protein